MSTPRLLFLRFSGDVTPPSHPISASGPSTPPFVVLRPWAPRLPSQPGARERALLFDEVDAFSGGLPPAFVRFLRSLAPSVETFGRWGALLDLSGCERLYPDRRVLLRRIGERAMEEKLGSLAAGEGSSRLVARLAAATAPVGSWWQVEGDRAERFLAPFPLRCLPQGRSRWVPVLEELGLNTLGEVAALPPRLLREALGEESLEVWREARGQGSSVLPPAELPPYLREHHVFPAVYDDEGWVRSVVGVLADRLAARLRDRGLQAGRVELRIRRHGGETTQRSRRLDPPSAELTVLRECTWGLWGEMPTARRAVSRCVLEVGGLRRAAPEALSFDFARVKTDLAPFIARIRRRFGDGAVQWSPELWMAEREGS